MVSIEKLKQIRAAEGQKLKQMQGVIKEREQKIKLKEDIRKIRGATMRAKYGTTMETVKLFGDAIEKSFKGSMPVLKNTGKAIGKGMFAIGEAANDYYGAPVKKRKR